jgi:hypothetical protein
MEHVNPPGRSRPLGYSNGVRACGRPPEIGAASREPSGRAQPATSLSHAGLLDSAAPAAAVPA